MVGEAWERSCDWIRRGCGGCGDACGADKKKKKAINRTMIEWALSALAVTIAALALLGSLYQQVRKKSQNDYQHILEDISEIKERLTAVESDVSWLKNNRG
ncbi:unnamed protein product [marine sediment metagenome]|uniref:Uncharacterized protein n=1 Tax=marine sediment metagenome TaxID=412755 RepID=X1MAP7_9ZZZZ